MMRAEMLDGTAARTSAAKRHPRIATFFAATAIGSVMALLFIALYLPVSASEHPYRPGLLNLIFLAVALPIFVLAVVGAAKLFRRAVGPLGVMLGIGVLVVSFYFTAVAAFEVDRRVGNGPELVGYSPAGGEAYFLVYWGEGAEPAEWRRVAHETCVAQSIGSLARELDEAPHATGRTRPTWPSDGATAEAVARAYAWFFQNPHDVDVEQAIYSGCLQGFRDQR
jgi:hypothetical protein